MDPNEDPEALERRSDSIRANVGETLDALQRNYSPGALVDRSMDLLRDQGGEMATNIMQTVRRNPMPTLLVLAGVTWMIAAQLRTRRDGSQYDDGGNDDLRGSRFGGSSDYQDDDLSLDTSYTYGGTPADVTSDGSSSYTTGATGSLDDGDDANGSGIGGRLSGARDKLRSATQSATDKVSGSARRVSEGSRRVAERAREQSRRAGEGMTRLLREQPFAVGAAGIAVGALIGALLPETAQEDRVLGPARDRALDKARNVREHGIETARQKLHEAVDRTRDAVRGEGDRDEQDRGTQSAGDATPVI